MSNKQDNLLQNRNNLKIRKFNCYIYYQNIITYIIIQAPFKFRQLPFTAKKAQFTTVYCVSSLNLEQILCVSLTFMTVTHVQMPEQLFCRVSLNCLSRLGPSYASVAGVVQMLLLGTHGLVQVDDTSGRSHCP